jgi:DNA-binding transcriptional MerR regulator
LTFESDRSRSVAGVDTTYRIAEVAARSGFPSSTLRYYEQIGVLPEPARTTSGYRAYDESSLDRLAFIARAKQLGCTLPEITDLVGLWDDRSCAPVQERLRHLAATKIGDAQRRVAELTAFIAQLQRASVTLGAHTPDGPCDEGCGCATVAPDAPDPVDSTTAAADRDPAIACTLGATDMDGRIDEWQRLLTFVTARDPLPDGGLRLTLAPDAPVGETAALAAAEQQCCAFFGFALTVDDRGTALEVHAPAAADAVAALFGIPS